MKKTEFENEEVEAVFASYREVLRERILELRELVFAVAATTDGVGVLYETLKWGQPSYLTNETKSGTNIRIDKNTKNGGDYALFVNCKTSLVNEWREIYPNLKYGGTRSVHFKLEENLPFEELSHMIGMALTYKIRKK